MRGDNSSTQVSLPAYGEGMPFDSVTLARPDGQLTGLFRPGQGRPIVLLHGAMGDAPAWLRVAERLAPTRPLLLPNRRGRRDSTHPDETYSVGTEVGDLWAWIETLPGPVDLVTHSFGGLIATEAVRRGAPVASLLLYDPVARPFADDAVRSAIRQASDAGDLDTVVVLINTALSGYDQEHVARLRATGAWAALLRLAAPAASELDAIERFEPPWEDYRQLGVPVTLLAGEHSVSRAPYGDSVATFRRALGVREQLLPGEDHIAHVTAPDLLADAIATRLGATPATGDTHHVESGHVESHQVESGHVESARVHRATEATPRHTSSRSAPC